jgi:hypothetical protein
MFCLCCFLYIKEQLFQISAWFFSLYINDLISELKAVNSGISISDLNIPAILLADDTTLRLSDYRENKQKASICSYGKSLCIR